MNLPLQPSPGSSAIPGGPTCLKCGKKIGEIEGFIRLTSGAILYCDKKRDTGGPSDRMDSVFSLWYHGPHPVTGTTEDGRPIIGISNNECRFEIVTPVRGGQVDIHFCSTPCLSSFFAEVVTQFDDAIETTQNAEHGEGSNASPATS